MRGPPRWLATSSLLIESLLAFPGARVLTYATNIYYGSPKSRGGADRDDGRPAPTLQSLSEPRELRRQAHALVSHLRVALRRSARRVLGSAPIVIRAIVHGFISGASRGDARRDRCAEPTTFESCDRN